MMSRSNKPNVTVLEPDEIGRSSRRRKSPNEQNGNLSKRLEMAREQHLRKRLRAKHDRDQKNRNDDDDNDDDGGDAGLEAGRRETRSTTMRQKKGKETKREQAHAATSADNTNVEGRKPWETLVIGDLGENLSYIEEKDREILQQRFILKHHEENWPGQAEHHKRLLEKMIQERAQMEGDEENYLPAEEREANNRVTERVETLHWALDTCECEAEAVNIRTALEGYASGEIGYSENFTLIYGGHIVDICPTYQSFCADRSERLQRYADKYGAGWLWTEPPLTDSGAEVLAMKGLCLGRERPSSWGIGHYGVHLSFEVDKSKVMSEGRMAGKNAFGDTRQHSDTKAWAHFKTLLDSGATVPMLHSHDLQHLAIDMKWYSSQGVVTTNTANGKARQRFFEMYVSVCTEDGRSIVGQSNPATWPSQPPVLGGFIPVIVSTAQLNKPRVEYQDRLSGLLPFDATYVSSAPTTDKIWLGEDRRDVLGASRFPGHLRYDAEKLLKLNYPPKLDGIRIGTETPDTVIFAHHLKDDPGSQFIDTDRPGQRGSSAWAIKRARRQGSGKGASKQLSLITEDTAEIIPPAGKTSDTNTPGWHGRQLSSTQIRALNKLSRGQL